MERALDELTDEIGTAAVLRPGTDVLDAYERPARGPGGPAAAVVRPASTEEVRRVVRWAVRHGARLLPQGANTGLVGASVPPPSGSTDETRPLVVLSTERMTAPVEMHPDDRVAIVPAGLRLSALEELARPHDLTFPIDLGADPCLGAMVATNTGGARMARYGDVRRRTLGVEAVLADTSGDDGGPSVLDDLTRLRKDNTGPAATGFLVGSAGAFGVITRVAVELARRPRERACALLAVARADDAVAALRVVEGALGEQLAAYEVMSRAAVAAATSTVAGVRTPWPEPEAPAMVVLVEAAGAHGVDAALETAVAEVGRSGSVADAVAVPVDDAWALRHAITEGLARTGVVVGFDVSVPRSQLPEFRADVIERVAAALPRATVADFGHWGDGGTHCNLVFPAARPPDDDERAAAREIVFGTAVRDHEGSFSAEHGIGPHNAEWWEVVTPPDVRRFVRDLRDRCDPHRVLGHPALPF